MFAQSFKRIITSIFIALIISVAIYVVIELGFNIVLPEWIVPIFMIIATVIELRREAVKENEGNLPNKNYA